MHSVNSDGSGIFDRPIFDVEFTAIGSFQHPCVGDRIAGAEDDAASGVDNTVKIVLQHQIAERPSARDGVGGVLEDAIAGAAGYGSACYCKLAVVPGEKELGGIHQQFRWRAADDRITAYIAVGNYQAATRVALGTGEDDATPAFNKLDEALTKGIDQSRSQLRSDIVNARRVLSGATVGAALLSVVAAVAVALGIWPRLNEYR